MAKPNNRKCICCSTEYRYCNTCSEDSSKPSWYAIYCSENCKKLYQAVSGYLANAVSLEETRARFDDCDLSYKHKLKSNFIETINDVCKNEVQAEITLEVDTTEHVVDETIVLSETEETTEKEVEVIKETKYGNKNKNKKKIVFE